MLIHTPEERQTYIDIIRALPAEIEKLVDGLSANQLTTPYLDGEWTVAQNVHHLVDSHVNSQIRLRLMLTEKKPPLKPYDQELWAELPDAVTPDIEDSLLILRGLHNRWAALFESLTEEQWARPGVHGELGEITPDFYVQFYAEHCEAHIDQIQRTLAAAE